MIYDRLKFKMYTAAVVENSMTLLINKEIGGFIKEIDLLNVLKILDLEKKEIGQGICLKNSDGYRLIARKLSTEQLILESDFNGLKTTVEKSFKEYKEYLKYLVNAPQFTKVGNLLLRVDKDTSTIEVLETMKLEAVEIPLENFMYILDNPQPNLDVEGKKLSKLKERFKEMEFIKYALEGTHLDEIGYINMNGIWTEWWRDSVRFEIINPKKKNNFNSFYISRDKFDEIKNFIKLRIQD